MMLEMVFGRFISVANGLLRVAMRDERLMRRMRIVLPRVVLRCLAMVRRRLLMVLGCGEMVFRTCENSGHGSSNFRAVPTGRPRLKSSRLADRFLPGHRERRLKV
jgi:hypothetical protein